MSQTQQMSAIVDELLELVGLVPQNAPEPQPLAQNQSLQALQLEYDKLVEKKIRLRASKEQLDRIRVKEVAVATQLTHKGAEEQFVRPALDELAKICVVVENEIARSRALRVKLLAMVTDAAGEPLKDKIVDGATEGEAAPLRKEREELLKLLANPATGAPEPDATVLRTAYQKVDAFTGQVTGLKQEVMARKAAREKLTNDLGGLILPNVTDAKDIVPGATAEEAKPLRDERDRIQGVIDNADATLSLLNAEFAQISALRAAKGRSSDVVAARVKRKEICAKAAQDAIDSLPEEAETGRLEQQHEEIKDKLATDPLGETPLSQAETALAQLQKDVELETETVKEYKARKLAFEPRVAELRELVDVHCDGFDIRKPIDLLQKIESELEGPVRAIDFDGYEGPSLETRLSDIRRDIAAAMEKEINTKGRGQAAKALGYLDSAAKAAWEEAQSLLPFADEQYKSELEELEDKKEEILTLVTPQTVEPEKGKGGRSGGKPKPEVKQPSFEDVKQAFTILAGMRQTIDEVRQSVGDAILTITDMRDAALKAVAPDNPTGLPPGYDAILNERRLAVTGPLGDELTSEVTIEVCNQAKADAALFTRDYTAATSIKQSWATCQDYTTVHGAARPPMQAELAKRHDAVLAAGKVKAPASDLPGAETLCQRLQDQLAAARQEATKKGTATGALSQLVVDGQAPDQDTIALVYDLAGPDAIEDLAGRPATLTTLAECCKKATPQQKDALRLLVTEGLGPSGKALANLARSGDADAILDFATAYAGPGEKDNRGKLRAMVEDGGLAEQPAVLGDILGHGVQAANNKGGKRASNVARIKELGNAFGTGNGPELLKNLSVGCGLGTARPDDPAKPNDPSRPGVMAELLMGEGGLGDVASLRTLAEEFDGDDPADQTDRDRLKGLIEDGGFGGRPRAFGPLVGTLKAKMPGGMKGAAKSLKELGQTFEGATERANLKEVLDKGGMSGDVTEPNRTHEHPDSLAKVFVGGLGGRADKLKEFTDAFGDDPGHSEQCRKMMESWNEFPDNLKDARKPDEKIKLLLDHHFNDDVSRLQTQFTDTLDQIADDDKRKLATRFGPHLLKKNTPPNTTLPGLDDTRQNDPQRNVQSVILGFILKRHCPEFARDGQKQDGNDWLTDPQSYFPVGTTAEDIKKILTEAFNHAQGPDRGQSDDVPVTDMSVEVALKANGTCVHCFPTSGLGSPHPKEIAKFDKADAERMFDAVR